MRRSFVAGMALTGAAVMALPIFASLQAGAQTPNAHPAHLVRPAAALNIPAEITLHQKAQAVADTKKFYDVVAFTQAVEAAQHAGTHRGTTARTSGGGGGGGGTCAGSIPGNVIYRESKCDPKAVNSRSGAAGKYQVLPSTWAGYGGYGSAADAPEAVQDQWAADAYAQVGCRPWGGC
jgi:Transglycosylase-like domain